MLSLFKGWKLSSTQMALYLAFYFATLFNYAFYRQIFTLQPFSLENSASYFVLTIPLGIFFALIIIWQILIIPILHKIIIPVFLVISAAISYNAIFFNVYFDSDMLENVLQTHTAEALELITPSYVLWILGFGILPALLYLNTKIQYKSVLKEIGTRIFVIVLVLLAVLGIAKIFYQDYASFFRNNRGLGHLIMPSNFVVSGAKKIQQVYQSNIPYTQLELNARQQKADAKRNVIVIVVGETTRAQNWGLNGYEHQTTPRLAKRGDEIFNFNNVSSCGTSTAVSVPCMFSLFERENYNALKAQKQDNLLDILQRANIEILWLNNNSDCKGVCKNIPNKTVIGSDPALCNKGLCLDNILFTEFDRILATPSDKDLVVVLHTVGSHGPAYYERYTDEFRHFVPTCDTKEINRCNNQELVNTYNNTILYVDQFLDQVIMRLEDKDEWNSAIYYVSDHGESLGENGLYLHGTPYIVAPETQTKVPMFLWFSRSFLATKPIDFACLRQNAKTQSYSQDNLFHTMLSLTEIELSISTYKPSLDILSGCRKPH